MIFFYRHILLCFFCAMCLCSSAQIDTSLSVLRHKNSFDTSVKSPLLLIADIAITGNKRTKPYIIEREIPFKQGDYVAKKDLEALLIIARQQVINTSLFVDVYVYVSTQQGELVFINVDVKERWYLFPLPYFKLVDRNFNQWWVEEKRSFDRVNYGLKFIQNNVSGRNDRLNISLISGYNHQVDLQYEQPFVDRALKSGFNVRFLFSQQHELNYKTDLSKQLFYKQDEFVMKIIKAEAAYLYRPAIKTKHVFRLSYTQEEVSDTILKLNPNYFSNHATRVAFPELSYTLEYFNADYLSYPLRGFMGDFSIAQRGFSQDMHMTQLEFHSTYSHPFIANTNLQIQAAGIIKVPFTQPYFNQQLFGYGGVFFRGLEYYVFDGVAGVLARATERKKLWAVAIQPGTSAKKRAAIPFTFYAKLYSDVGYGYTPHPGNSLLNNRLITTWGAGLDIVSIYDAVFKFEYSFNQLGGQGLFFHVRADF
jgi:outer membrane protein assembly factor BamA